MMMPMSDASLGGLWEFSFLGQIDSREWCPASFHGEEKVFVPSAFDALPAHAGARGVGVYRTRFAVPANHPAQLGFGAVSMESRVFVDGQLVHENACGYAPFWIHLPPSEATERELIVWTDNRFHFDQVPMHEEFFDFYQYGGVLRDVALRILPKTGPYVDHVQVIPARTYRNGDILVRVQMGGECPAAIQLSLQFDGSETQSHLVKVVNGSAEFPVSVPNPRVWSPEHPSIHRLCLGTTPEDLLASRTVRFGLRSIEARDGCLWLNGEKLRLRGFNRHEWHPNYGPSTPQLQMMADLQVLKDLGCNFVRGSHYPQDQRFLDLCDELGFLVWEENLGWGQREKTFASAKFRQDHAKALRAMVKASCNHPCVILWGFLNEAGSDGDYVRPVMEESVKILREMDPSRLVTYASMFPLTDKYFDLADVISINTYPGWYACEGVGEPLELIGPEMERIVASIDGRGFGNKPILISEIGAEGLYGWRDSHNDFFTEEYQAAYLARACREVLGNPRLSGIALWHFSDVRTYGGGWSLKRPRTFNNKGILDEYRRPKTAYRAVREVFRGME